MKIPEKIEIGGIDFKILQADIIKKTGDTDYGYMDPKNEIIVLDESLSKQGRECTLVHEIIEALNELNQLGLNHQQISTLEHGIYRAIRQL